MNIESTIAWEWASQTSDQNRSIVLLNNKVVSEGPLIIEGYYGSPVLPLHCIGSPFALDMPDGMFRGHIVNAGGPSLVIEGTWIGRLGAFLNGKSDWGTWDIMETGACSGEFGPHETLEGYLATKAKYRAQFFHPPRPGDQPFRATEYGVYVRWDQSALTVEGQKKWAEWIGLKARPLTIDKFEGANTFRSWLDRQRRKEG